MVAQQNEKRAYPRIETAWPLVRESREGQKRIGHVANISLSGALLKFEEGYELEPGVHSVTLRLKNEVLGLPELALRGLREWEQSEKGALDLGIEVRELDHDTKVSFVRYLSRSDGLHVTAVIESGSEAGTKEYPETSS